MNKYLIEISHAPEECLKALDEVVAEAPALLDKVEWGCRSGKHGGWYIADRMSKSEVQNMILKVLQHRTHIVELGKYTTEEILLLDSFL